MFVEIIKGVYQTFNFRLKLAFFKFFSSEVNDTEIVRQKLRKKTFFWNTNQPIKVIALFSISNWEYQLCDALSAIGKVHHISWPHIHQFYQSKEYWIKGREKLNDYVKKEFDRYYDIESNIIVFMYVSDFTIKRETIKYFSKSNTVVINFCWDDILYFKKLVKRQLVGIYNLSKEVDFNLTLSPEAIPIYHYYKSPVYFWNSMLAEENVDFNLPQINQEENDSSFYVLFIGSNYGWRKNFIRRLEQKGITVKCFGSGWPNGSLSNELMMTEIRRAPLTLGFANVGYTKNITTIKGRDFEVPAFGGLYLTQQSLGILKYYEPEKEVFLYQNFSDCYDQIMKIKNNKKLSDTVRLAGYRKALTYCTWQGRGRFLNKLLGEILFKLH
jgi:hypothetical protein